MNAKMERAMTFYNRMRQLGIESEDIEKLRRIEMTLARWSEHECNGNIQRDEKTGVAYWHYGRETAGPFQTSRIPDRERGALKRLESIMAKYPTLKAYHQGDPRGCSLYIVRESDLVDKWTGVKRDIDTCYNQGVAVCY